MNRDSHGLKVAQHAGMPEAAMEVAREALAWLKDRAEERVARRADLVALGQSLALNSRSGRIPA